MLSAWTSQLSFGAAAKTDLRALRNQKPTSTALAAVSFEIRNLNNSFAGSKLGEFLTMPQPQPAAYVEPPGPPGPTGGRAIATLSSLNQALLSSLRATSPKKGHWRMKATLS